MDPAVNPPMTGPKNQPIRLIPPNLEKALPLYSEGTICVIKECLLKLKNP